MRQLSKGLSPVLGLFAYMLVCFCSPVLAQNDSVVVTAVQRAKEAGVEEEMLNIILGDSTFLYRMFRYESSHAVA